MVKHVILWTLKDEITAEEKENIKQGIKEGLEGLKGKVPGIADSKVRPYTKIRSCLDYEV